jgi:hypothetical protein
MPKRYPSEFRRRVLDLVAAGEVGGVGRRGPGAIRSDDLQLAATRRDRPWPKHRAMSGTTMNFSPGRPVAWLAQVTVLSGNNAHLRNRGERHFQRYVGDPNWNLCCCSVEGFSYFDGLLGCGGTFDVD